MAVLAESSMENLPCAVRVATGFEAIPVDRAAVKPGCAREVESFVDVPGLPVPKDC